jgi:hypothetical protein
MTLLLLLTAATGAWAADTYTVTFKANGNTKTVENVTLPHTFELDPIITELYPSLSGGHGSPAGTSASGNTNVTAYNNNSKHYASISAPFEGAVTVTGQFFKDFTNHQYTLEINCMEELVTISDDKTEATIKMPKYDVTATYTIKRDLTVDVTAQVGDGTQEQPRYRVKKDGNKFIPADMEMAAVPALFTVNDAIEQKALTQTQDYIVQIYAIDAEGQPTGNPMTFANFTFEPGIYAVRAVAADGSDYAGETDLSNTFQLFQGYEVEVAAKEFITYYKDEPLYADTETSADAQLYTISSVNGDQATLSAAIETAPSRTPLLIFNNSDQAKTFLLIPADAEPNLALTVADEFVGTLEATTIAASTEGQTNYAFNGKAFVFVKNAIEVGPNKAWLRVNTGEPSARITIVFDSEATGIKTTDCTDYTDSVWYDLNGRKVAAPSKKGIYIMNGKKVVVK